MQATAPTSHPRSPYEKASDARWSAAIAAGRTFQYIVNAIDHDRHTGSGDIWRPARSQPGHEGDPPLVIDARANQILQQILGSLGRAPMVFDSEESGEASDAPAGTAIAIVDPLDGTTAARCLGVGYCTALLIAEVTGESTIEPRAGAIASHTGIVSWTHLGPQAGEVAYGTQPLRVVDDGAAGIEPTDATDQLTWLDGVTPGLAQSVAVVAGSRRRRDALDGCFDLPGPVFGLAGNPIARELIRGGVSAVIEPVDVALRDAIYLLPFERLGGLVTDLNGYPLDVYGTFSQATRIGPFIAANSNPALDHVLDRRR